MGEESSKSEKAEITKPEPLQTKIVHNELEKDDKKK